MKRLFVVLLVMVVAAAGFAAGDQEGAEGMEIREYDLFLGYEREDYPADGTIFGDWLEQQTGVRINWEFVVGDLQQKVSLIAASGDYPDIIHPRNYTQILLEANAIIPYNDLIDEYGPDIKRMYGDRLEWIRQPDGNIYWFPQVMPYGDEWNNPNPPQALWVQEAVFASWNYQYPQDFEQAVDWLIEYAKENPTIDGNKTFAFTGQYDSWRWFSTSNIPTIFSGHPNDGAVNVDWIGDKWVASHYWATDAEYESYRILNKAHLEGLYDTESFVMSHDQYIAKLTGGSILAFHDQDWHFGNAQNILLEQDEGRWYVPLPVVLEGYNEEFMNPPQPQVSEGITISIDAEDPEGIMQWFNTLATREALILRTWGREGIDYMVDNDGMFYRTDEQIAQWQDQDWVRYEYGAYYWTPFLRIDGGSTIWDGQNKMDPGRQPSLYFKSRRAPEQRWLEEMGYETRADAFNPPDLRRSTYFPAWTITIPPNSEEGIFRQRVDDIRRKYIPLLIMAEPGQYDAVWAEYTAELDGLGQENFQRDLEFFQEEIDRRVEQRGGY